MSNVLPLIRAAFAVVALLGSLALVTWRQSRAFEVLKQLDGVRTQISVADAEGVDLERRIQVLESRSRVVPEARTRLGMHTANVDELVILPAEVVSP